MFDKPDPTIPHKLRALAVCELTQNRSKYADVQPENEDWDSFLSELKKDKTWGNEAAILALVNVLNITVVIHQIAQEVQAISPPTVLATTKTIEVAYLHRCHYDVIKQVDTTQTEKTKRTPVSSGDVFQQINLPILLQTAFATDTRTAEWLFSNDIVPTKTKCPGCTEELTHSVLPSCGVLGGYYCKKCDIKWSLRGRSILRNHKISLHDYIIIAFGWLQGKERSAVSADVPVSVRTIIRIFNDLNVASSILLEKHSTRLGGENRIVEIDECCLPRSKYSVGRVKEECWVLGMIERPITQDEIPRCVLLSVPDRKKETLVPLIQLWVKEHTTLCTDKLQSYVKLNEYGYTHESVNHSKNFVDPVTKAHTQRIESMWRWVRAKAVPKTGCLPSSLDYFLSAFSYRRIISGNFIRFLKDIFSIRFDAFAAVLSTKKTGDYSHRLFQEEQKMNLLREEAGLAPIPASSMQSQTQPPTPPQEIQTTKPHSEIESTDTVPTVEGDSHMETPTSVDILTVMRYTSKRKRRSEMMLLLDDPHSIVEEVHFDISKNQLQVERQRQRNALEKSTEAKRQTLHSMKLRSKRNRKQ